MVTQLLDLTTLTSNYSIITSE